MNFTFAGSVRGIDLLPVGSSAGFRRRLISIHIKAPGVHLTPLQEPIIRVFEPIGAGRGVRGAFCSAPS